MKARFWMLVGLVFAMAMVAAGYGTLHMVKYRNAQMLEQIHAQAAVGMVVIPKQRSGSPWPMWRKARQNLDQNPDADTEAACRMGQCQDV